MSTFRPSTRALQREIERLRAQKKRRITILILLSVLFIIAAIGVSIVFLARPVQVNGLSMEPTLLPGDLLLMDCVTYEPEYGDIVVAKLDLGKETWLVKRIVGLPGDELLIDSQTGQVCRNGKYLIEDYVKTLSFAPCDIDFPVIVPENHVFVMGDNRNTSVDSRSQEVGMVSLDDVVGRAWSSNRILYSIPE